MYAKVSIALVFMGVFMGIFSFFSTPRPDSTGSIPEGYCIGAGASGLAVAFTLGGDSP